VKKFDSNAKNIAYLGHRWASIIVDPIKTFTSLVNFPGYLKDVVVYSRMQNSEAIKFIDTYPVLTDKTPSTPYDPHYFYQDIWAAKEIYRSKSKVHVDVGSNIEFVGFLTSFTKVKFVDIRSLEVDLQNFEGITASILDLPFADNSVKSLSCLHVAEHIGLGRYGDSLDPGGTQKACRELARVLAKGGNLYFSLPVGKPRLCFNAHRIHSPKQIIRYFRSLKLKGFSGIDDNGNFERDTKIETLARANYACGLFKFTK